MIIDIPPQTEQLLIASAKAQGISTGELITKWVEKHVKSVGKRQTQMGILSDFQADPAFYEPLDSDELEKW